MLDIDFQYISCEKKIALNAINHVLFLCLIQVNNSFLPFPEKVYIPAF